MFAKLLGDDHPATLSSMAHMERAHVRGHSGFNQSVLDKERRVDPTHANDVSTVSSPRAFGAAARITASTWRARSRCCGTRVDKVGSLI